MSFNDKIEKRINVMIFTKHLRIRRIKKSKSLKKENKNPDRKVGWKLSGIIGGQ